MIGRPCADVPIWRVLARLGLGCRVGWRCPRYSEQLIVGHAGHRQPGVELDDGRRPLDAALAVIVRPAGDVEAQPVEHAGQALLEVVPVTQSRSSGGGRGMPRRPLMGLVTLSNEASLVGTMTSGGTDVIEMPASTSRSTTGATVEVVVGDDDGGLPTACRRSVEKAVMTTVVGAVEATDGAAETGASDVVGAPVGPVAPEAHEVVRSTKPITASIAATGVHSG